MENAYCVLRKNKKGRWYFVCGGFKSIIDADKRLKQEQRAHLKEEHSLGVQTSEFTFRRLETV
jgi:hypothetical protein